MLGKVIFIIGNLIVFRIRMPVLVLIGSLFSLSMCGSGNEQIVASEPVIGVSNRNAARAAIVLLTMLESLAINSQIELLGVAQADKSFTPLRYIAHNVANACPTYAGWLGVDVKQYTEQGPMVDATDISAVCVVGSLFAQNYYLANKIYKSQYPAFESLYLTIGGFLLAWTARLGLGVLNSS